jgi:hypothetical protein
VFNPLLTVIETEVREGTGVALAMIEFKLLDYSWGLKK